MFETVLQAGFDPTDFKLRVIDDDEDEETALGEQTSLAHPASGSQFVVLDRIGDHQVFVRSSVGDGSPTTAIYEDWRQPLESWLGEIRKELEAPDLWSLAGQRQDVFADPSRENVENSPFDERELAEIVSQLAEVEEYARASARLGEGEMRILQIRLNYFADAAARRVGRFDWRNLVMGALLGDIISGALPPESTRSVLTTLLRSVGHILGHPLPELPTG